MCKFFIRLVFLDSHFYFLFLNTLVAYRKDSTLLFSLFFFFYVLCVNSSFTLCFSDSHFYFQFLNTFVTYRKDSSLLFSLLFFYVLCKFFITLCFFRVSSTLFLNALVTYRRDSNLLSSLFFFFYDLCVNSSFTLYFFRHSFHFVSKCSCNL